MQTRRFAVLCREENPRVLFCCILLVYGSCSCGCDVLLWNNSRLFFLNFRNIFLFLYRCSPLYLIFLLALDFFSSIRSNRIFSCSGIDSRHSQHIQNSQCIARIDQHVFAYVLVFLLTVFACEFREKRKYGQIKLESQNRHKNVPKQLTRTWGLCKEFPQMQNFSLSFVSQWLNGNEPELNCFFYSFSFCAEKSLANATSIPVDTPRINNNKHGE